MACFRGIGGCLAAGLFALGVSPAARAQDLQGADASRAGAMELQLFLPTPTAGTTFTIDRPTVPRHMTFVVGVGGSHAAGLLEREQGEPAETVDVVPRYTQLELLAAIGLFEVLEIGVALPLVLAEVPQPASDVEDPGGAVHEAFDPNAPIVLESATTPGDLRLTLKLPLLRGDFGLAARGVFLLPTGDGSRFTGMNYWATQLGAVAAFTAGKLTLGGEVAWRMRRRSVLPGLEQDDELLLAGGAAYAIAPMISAIAEAQIRVGLGGRTVGSDEQPAEGDLGVRITPVHGLSFDVGAGTGLRQGYGSPAYRVFLIARFSTEREQCPAGPEDYDGYEDGDYCNDVDNDLDGRNDAVDVCPNDAEDVDQFVDDDGCPDTDNDADGVLDAADACPTESEDRDGFEDTDGCPEPDNDRDGIADGLDACPNEAEDADQFQDDDGCPEPGPQRAVVTVTETRILISERIYFDFDRDTIRPVSMPLLDQVAAVILELGGNRRIRVEGYTDDQGDARYNTDLSYRRARAVVEYLSGRGVPRPRLDFVGYGNQRPVAPNDSEEGRALNRRVEFTIIEVGDQPAGGGTGTGGTGAGRRRDRERDRERPPQ